MFIQHTKNLMELCFHRIVCIWLLTLGLCLSTHPGTPPNFSPCLIVFRGGIIQKSLWLSQHIIMMTEQQDLNF